VPEGLGFSRQT